MNADQDQGQGSSSPVRSDQVVDEGQGSGQDKVPNVEATPPRNNKEIVSLRKTRAEKEISFSSFWYIIRFFSTSYAKGTAILPWHEFFLQKTWKLMFVNFPRNYTTLST